MTLFKQALANAKLMILILVLLNLLWAGVTLYSVTGLSRAPEKMTFYVPPTIPETGLVTKVGTVPKSTVYSFTYYIWQSLQTWLTDGEKNYHQNLTNFSPYLTDDFRNELSKEGVSLDKQGMLLNHEQVIFNANQAGFDVKDVKNIGHGTWLVHLVMRTVNRVATGKDNASFAQSNIVRDATTSYVFKVIRLDHASADNHWGLQLAGFAVPPKTMTIYQ